MARSVRLRRFAKEAQERRIWAVSCHGCLEMLGVLTGLLAEVEELPDMFVFQAICKLHPLILLRLHVPLLYLPLLCLRPVLPVLSLLGLPPWVLPVLPFIQDGLASGLHRYPMSRENLHSHPLEFVRPGYGHARQGGQSVRELRDLVRRCIEVIEKAEEHLAVFLPRDLPEHLPVVEDCALEDVREIGGRSIRPQLSRHRG